MKTRIIVLGLILVVMALTFAVPATGQAGDQIIVNNADEVRQTTVSSSQGLSDSIAGVAPRIVLQYANQLRPIQLASVPSTLQSLLGQVPARIVVEYANGIRQVRLSTIPGSLQTLLGQVSDRIVLQYANTLRRDDLASPPGSLDTLLGQMSSRVVLQYANENREVRLGYPASLLGDTTPPQISGIAAAPGAGSTLKISWMTDEFADSVILYGTQSGVYAHTVSDPLYVKRHEMTLTDITAGTTIYYRVRSTDQSGNTWQSAEQTFTGEIPVYLPVILKQRR